MFNILVAIRVWASEWQSKNIEIFCDNEAVVTVLNTGKTRDNWLATISRNIFMESSKFDISLKFTHVQGKSNQVADLLSRWQDSHVDRGKLQQLAPNASWLNIKQEHLFLDLEI